MVLMPVAMAPMQGGTPCGYASPSPVPELPVRQPDRGARRGVQESELKR